MFFTCFKQEDQLIECMTKAQAMVLRIYALWYNGFVFRQWLPFLWEKPEPIHLMLVGLTAGWQTQYGWISKSFKSSTD